MYLRREPPQILRGVDVAYYSPERVQQLGDDVPPDLVVEVHLPDEQDMHRKVKQYLEAGVRAVWVVDPSGRSITRYAPGEKPTQWTDPRAMVTEPVLPGFSCRLGEFFR